jgi:hypothetical protein
MSGPLNSDGHSWDIPLDQVQSPHHLGGKLGVPAPAPDEGRYPEPGPHGTLAD